MNITPFTGQTLSQSGIYSNIPIEAYHLDTSLCDGFSISSSGLRQFIDRPSLYWCRSPYNPECIDEVKNQALNFGQAAHHLLLGEQGFAERFALRPEQAPDGKAWNGNNKSCKQWLQEQTDLGKRIITSSEIDHIRGIQRSLEAHPAVQNGILNGLVEHSMLAKFNNVWLRARPDVLPQAGNDFVDLKTTARIDYDSLQKTIFDNGYHIQAAVVRMVAKQAMGKDFEFGGFFFVFVEKAPPYDVRILELKECDMDLGEMQVNQALEGLEVCIKHNQWPGHEGVEQRIDPIEMQTWAKTKIQTEIDFQKREIAA